MEQFPADNRVGVFTLDANFRVQVWDAELERASGLSFEDVHGKSIIALFPDLETRGLVKYFRRVLEDNVVEVLAPAFHHYLIPCATRTPSLRFDKMQQRVTIAPLREGDRTVGLIVSVEDVTRRIDRERDLAEQLAHSDEMIRLQAAQVLAQDREVEAADSLLGALHDQSWRVRRVAVEGLSQRAAPDAIAALLESMRRDHYNLSLLNSALQVLALSDVDTLSPLVAFLRGDDPDLRMQAALALGEQREVRAIPDLISALSDPDVNVRYHAIEALGKLRSLEAVEILTKIAEERDFFLSYVALDALSQIGDASIAARIVPLLEDELLNEAAANLLGKLGDEHTVAPLAERLNVSRISPAVITRALAALYDRYHELYDEGHHIADLSRRFIDSRGIQSLVAFLQEDPEEDLRSLALVVGWLKGPAVEQVLTHLLGKPEARSEVIEALARHGGGVTELLSQQLAAQDLETRTAAVIALGRIGDKAATPGLITILQEDERLIITAVDSLGKIGDPRAFEALLELLSNKSAAVRQAAIGALNSLGAPETAERVKVLLNDANPYVRESAARIAGYFGFPDCTSQILDRCDDETEQVRTAAIESLPFFDNAQTLARLVAALSNETPKVRAAAARALAHVDMTTAVPALLQAINDDDPWVRYFAARSLGSHTAEAGIAPLSNLVRFDKFNHVRIAALDALGQIGGEQAASVATDILERDDRDLAPSALAALGRIRHPNALPPLIAATRSPRLLLRVSALTALGVRGGDEVIEPLKRCAVDEEPAVFQNAIAILGELGTPNAIASLIDLLANSLHRESAIAALAKAGEKVEHLGRGLSHQNPEVRRGVVEALARMKLERAAELIQSALQDNEAAVRLAASSALGVRHHPHNHGK